MAGRAERVRSRDLDQKDWEEVGELCGRRLLQSHLVGSGASDVRLAGGVTSGSCGIRLGTNRRTAAELGKVLSQVFILK